MGGAMWVWALIAVLVGVLLVVVIISQSKKQPRVDAQPSDKESI